MDDIELLQVYDRTGDQSAFAEIVSRHGAMVYRVCFRVLRDQHDAQDASQAVFMALSKKSSKLQRGGSRASWLFAVARQAVPRRPLVPVPPVFPLDVIIVGETGKMANKHEPGEILPANQPLSTSRTGKK